MPDEPKTPIQVEEIPSIAGGISAVASAAAPFIFINGVPTYGFNDGVVCMTLEALRYTSVNGQVLADRVVVGHLRMTPGGFQHLKSAISGIDLIMAKPQENQIN